MADFRAIGGVSATLQRLLRDRMELLDADPVSVTIGPPRFGKPDEPAREEARVNIFLYRVSENGYLQNQEIPGRAASSGYGRPPLSLNLHYLITAYGSEERQEANAVVLDETRAHFLLGSAMRVLHDHPIITDRLLTVRNPAGLPVLHESIRGEFERVKLSLEPLSLEDITKIWTALTLRYRLSAAYAVHVVQIETRATRVFPRPVGEPSSPTRPPGAGEPGPAVDVITFRTPTITRVRAQRGDVIRSFPFAAVGDRLLIDGTSLAGSVTRVQLGDLSLPAEVATPLHVEVVVPDDALPDGVIIPAAQRLRPGAHALSVMVGDGVRRVRSNESVFMLVPRVVTATVSNRTLEIVGTRLVGERVDGETIVGRSTVRRAEYGTATSQLLRLPVPDTLPAAGVVVRLGEPLEAFVTPQEVVQVTIGIQRAAHPAVAHEEVPRERVPALLQAAIRAADLADPRFAGARVGLLQNRLALVAGGLMDAVQLSGPGADAFGFTSTQPPGADHSLLSGALDPFPEFSRNVLALEVRMGAAGPVDIFFPAPRTLDEAADLLQTALNEANAPASVAAAFRDASVVPFGRQLLVVPGQSVEVAFHATPEDPTSVRELQLRARYAVRVRVAGAEGVDAVEVELP